MSDAEAADAAMLQQSMSSVVAGRGSCWSMVPPRSAWHPWRKLQRSQLDLSQMLSQQDHWPSHTGSSQAGGKQLLWQSWQMLEQGTNGFSEPHFAWLTGGRLPETDHQGSNSDPLRLLC